MKLNDVVEGYEVIQICYAENWGVYLLKSIDEEDVFGVLDYSFETKSIYDFNKGLGIYTALDMFMGRMPISYRTLRELSGEM